MPTPGIATQKNMQNGQFQRTQKVGGNSGTLHQNIVAVRKNTQRFHVCRLR